MSLSPGEEDGFPFASVQSQSAAFGSRAVISSPLRRTTQDEALEEGGSTGHHAFFIPVQNEDKSYQQKMQKDKVGTIVCSGPDHQRHQRVQHHELHPLLREHAQNPSIPTLFEHEPIEAEDGKAWGDSGDLPQPNTASFAYSRPACSYHNQHGHQPQCRDGHNNIVTSPNSNSTPWYSNSYYASDYPSRGYDVKAAGHFESQTPAYAAVDEPLLFQQQQADDHDSLNRFRDLRAEPQSKHATGFLPRQPQHLWQQSPTLWNQQAQTPYQHCPASSHMFQNIPSHPPKDSEMLSIGPPVMFQRPPERTSMLIAGPKMMYQHTIAPTLKQDDLTEREFENQRKLEALGLRCTKEPIKLEGGGLVPLPHSLKQRSSSKQSKRAAQVPSIVPPLNEKILQPDLRSPFIVNMARPSDRQQLTVYQFLLRESLEYFTATQHDVDSRVRGRKQKVRLSQIGVRCRYCSHLTVSARGKGAVYYPKSLINVYQAAQNIATAHFNTAGYCCSFMPPEIAHEIEIQRPRRDASKAGRSYWVEKCHELGIYEDNCSLWIKKPKPP